MMRVAAVVWLLAGLGAAGQDDDPTRLVREAGATVSVKAGVIELRSSRGWMRTGGPLHDFRVRFEFRTTTPRTDAGLVLRAWPGGREGWPVTGYRLGLPVAPPARARDLFEARKTDFEVVEEGTIALRPAGEWQHVDVRAEGRRVTVLVNEAMAGVFEIDEDRGYLMFDSRHGHLQLRNLQLDLGPWTERRGPPTVTELKAMGGQMPEPVHEVRPEYPERARREAVQGAPWLEAVVERDGSVGSIRVRRSFGRLDAAAIAALRQWRFTPARLGEEAIPVIVDVELAFKLRR